MDIAQTPEVAPEVTPTTVEPEITPATEAQKETPSTEPDTPFFTEDELNELLNPKKVEEKEVTSPQLFEWKTDESAKQADPTAILTESLDQMIEELTTNEVKLTEWETKAKEAETKVQEYQEQVNAVEELFSKVQSVIWEDTAKALALGELNSVPPQYIPEKWKLVEEHPVLGTLVQSVLKGEDIDVPWFLKKLSESRRAAMPNIQATTPATPVKTEEVNPLKSIIGSIRSY